MEQTTGSLSAAVMPVMPVLPVMCPRFIGRAYERDALRQLLDRASDGQGKIALVSGEAGIGKSRLVAEARAYAAARGFLLLQGNCFHLDSAYPYAPLLDMLRASVARAPFASDPDPVVLAFARLLPELSDALIALAHTPLADPEQEKRRLFAALIRFCQEQASQQPVLLVVEDLHWCDDTSLEFLQTLAHTCATAPLFLLLTYRSDEAQPALRRCLTQLDRTRLAHEFRLAPLTRDDVDAMMRAMYVLPGGEQAHLLDVIYPLTEGNPFFVEEVLSALHARGEHATATGQGLRAPRIPEADEMALVPRSVLEAVQQRTACLTPDAKRLLTIAAVAGRRFNVTLLQEIMGCDDAQLLALLKEVMAAHLVVEEEADRFAFRHALTQQAIYTEMLARERRAMHRAIAETLERLSAASHAREQHLEDLAHHFYEAGVWQQALLYARAASEKAQALYAQQAAIEHLTHALDAAQRLGQTPTANLYLARGQAYGTLGEFDRAQDDFRHALDVARDMADAELEWQSMVALGFLWSGRDYGQAGQWFHQALDLTGQLGSPELRATSLNRLGNWLLNIGQSDGIVQAHEEALRIFEASSNTRGMAESLDLLAISHGLIGDRVKSVAMEERAIALFRDLHDDEGLCSVLATRALQMTLEANETTYHALHPADEVLRDAAESVRLARQIGSLPAQAFTEITLSYAHAYGGDLGYALAHSHEALRIATAIEHRQWMAFASQATADIYLALRQSAQARATLDAGLGFARDVNSGIMMGFLAALLALAYLLERDLPHAEATLSAVMPREQRPRTLAERHVAWAWGELALAQGAPARALERAEDLLVSAPGDQRDQPIPHLLLLKGESLVALGRLDEAAQTFADAQRGAEMRHDQSVLWRIHAEHARLLHRLKRDEAAQRESLAARQIIETLAATVEDAMLREQFLGAVLAQLPAGRPVSPRDAAKRAYGGLTAREREVAALVAQGKTSREIADLLVVSERTAEAHVGNILGKLGFTSRAQIAVWAVEHGLVAH